MIIDCHYHLDPRIQAIDPLIRNMNRHGIDKTALIPVMCDPIPHPSEYQLKVLRFLLTHKPFRGLSGKLVARFTPDGDIIMPKGVLSIYKDPDNRPVADALAAHPEHFLGWIFVNPGGQNDPIAEYEKWKSQKGFIGIKAHPFWHRYPPKALLPVAEKAAKDGIPLLIHVGFDGHGNYLPLINELPELKLILAHTGFPEYADTWQLIKNRPNVRVDLSADAYVNEKTTCRAVDILGADRCLFGTDGPYGTREPDGTFDNGFIKRRLEMLFQNRGIQKKLLGENFLELI